MIEYCMVSVLSVGLTWLVWRGSEERKVKWWGILLCALPWIILSSIRYDVGEDYLYRYVPYFNQVKKNPFHLRRPMEPLFHLIYLAVIYMEGGYPWIFFISAVLFFLCTFYAIFRYSESPAMSVFLLTGMCLVFAFFNLMRQMIGGAILMLALPYIRDRRPIRFLLCVALATLFHKSCLAFVVAYPLGRMRFNPLMVLILSISVVVLGDLVPKIMLYVISKTEYGFYINSRYDTGNVGYVTMAINVVLVAFTTYTYRKDGLYPILYNLQLATLWLALLSGKVVLIERLRIMFSLFSILLIPAAVGKLPRRTRMVCKVGIVLLYTAYCIYSLLVKNTHSVLPYRTIFERI